jgi:hypothetical protein
MKQHLLSALALALATSGLAACATGYYGGGGGGYSYYDGYYDDFYGPVSYGYWGPDNYFYYSTTVSGQYVRDDARHFQREAITGAHRFHMRGQQRAENRRDRSWRDRHG